MAPFLIDPHVHTAETSSCSHIPGAELARLYRAAGYDAIIVTDHYVQEFFGSDGVRAWPDQARRYLAGYRNARREGERVGLRVFLGLELRLLGSMNDYLVYGPDEDFLARFPRLFELDLQRLSGVIRGLGGRVVQAHPFRTVCTPADPRLIDAVEVFNGNPRHGSRNPLAQAFARRHALPGLSGSDAHQEGDIGRGGMRLPRPVESLPGFFGLIDQAELLSSPEAS